MQLSLRCDRCGAVIVVHPGPLIDLPQGTRLLELLDAAESAHKCVHKPEDRCPR